MVPDKLNDVGGFVLAPAIVMTERTAHSARFRARENGERKAGTRSFVRDSRVCFLAQLPGLQPRLSERITTKSQPWKPRQKPRAPLQEPRGETTGEETGIGRRRSRRAAVRFGLFLLSLRPRRRGRRAARGL
ncbi:hypothetical protein AOLI_G00236620 [Acnodon oligacanthus]